jgi:hypothetical protein
MQVNAQAPTAAGLELHLPLAENSVRFAIIGDNGTAGREEYEIGDLLEQFRKRMHFDFALMLGDNHRVGKSPADYKKKFAEPYHAY